MGVRLSSLSLYPWTHSCVGSSPRQTANKSRTRGKTARCVRAFSKGSCSAWSARWRQGLPFLAGVCNAVLPTCNAKLLWKPKAPPKKLERFAFRRQRNAASQTHLRFFPIKAQPHVLNTEKTFTPCWCCYFPIFYSLLVLLLLPNILLPSLT